MPKLVVDSGRRLIAPAVELYEAWLDAHAEWGPGVHEDGFGLMPGDDVSSVAGFGLWVARLNATSAQGRDGRCSYRWIVEDGRVLGGIALRHGDGELVRKVGHIGYGIRPSARRHGVATWALAAIIAQARVAGMDRVLVVCAAGNLGSVKTIERCGGVLESIQDTELGPARRYWITVAESRA
ncbi:GNAT family N-acetyltransferase [Nocardia alba]|uniref:Putative acetyltransferase n=1 Tax=Nocardia alba TaxID=225051 RepID=A0A4R1FTE1_9NOCA|nr:GNAT family N-acetyltransferase [Nocardia alba]TCJ96849.1 putative acetyltransferase [Nocardia alba]